jgi:hypothetical protein
MKGMQPVFLNEFADECVALLISWLFFSLDAWLFLGLSHRHATMKSNCMDAERKVLALGLIQVREDWRLNEFAGNFYSF